MELDYSAIAERNEAFSVSHRRSRDLDFEIFDTQFGIIVKRQGLSCSRLKRGNALACH